MKAMILAAGFGKRMLPLTATCPKPLLRVNGKPLIEYTLERLVDAGFDHLVINHAYLGQQIVDSLGGGQRWNISISYSAEPEPLETAGGIMQALPLLGEQPFVITNGDIWCDFDYSLLNAIGLSPQDALAHLVLVDNPAHNPSGDFSLNEGCVENRGDNMLTYSGIAVIHPQFFQVYDVDGGPLAPALRQAADDGRVSGTWYHGDWQDIGTPERLSALDQLLARGEN